MEIFASFIIFHLIFFLQNIDFFFLFSIFLKSFFDFSYNMATLPILFLQIPLFFFEFIIYIFKLLGCNDYFFLSEFSYVFDFLFIVLLLLSCTLLNSIIMIMSGIKVEMIFNCAVSLEYFSCTSRMLVGNTSNLIKIFFQIKVTLLYFLFDSLHLRYNIFVISFTFQGYCTLKTCLFSKDFLSFFKHVFFPFLHFLHFFLFFDSSLLLKLVVFCSQSPFQCLILILKLFSCLSLFFFIFFNFVLKFFVPYSISFFNFLLYFLIILLFQFFSLSLLKFKGFLCHLYFL